MAWSELSIGLSGSTSQFPRIDILASERQMKCAPPSGGFFFYCTQDVVDQRRWQVRSPYDCGAVNSA
jgi:hypothetical protein